MEKEKISELLTGLKGYAKRVKELKDLNFSGKEVKEFKADYKEMHILLVDYIQFRKDKQLSESAKGLQRIDEIFKSTYRWIGILSVTIAIPVVGLINLKFLHFNNDVLLALGAVLVFIIFFMIRRVQQQRSGLIKNLDENGIICNSLVRNINKLEKKKTPPQLSLDESNPNENALH